MAKESNECYARIAIKLNLIETKIAEIKTQLLDLKLGFVNTEHEKACLDEVEQAITTLLDAETTGDA